MITRLDVLLTHQKMAQADWTAARDSGETQWIAHATSRLLEVDDLVDRERAPQAEAREPQRVGQSFRSR